MRHVLRSLRKSFRRKKSIRLFPSAAYTPPMEKIGWIEPPAGTLQPRDISRRLSGVLS